MSSAPHLLAASLLLILAPHAFPADKPNLVVFLVDDLGIMDSSVPFLTDAAGQPKRYPLNDLYHTPHLERLAAQGVRANQFYAMSVCSPTRISILTGQNAARHRTTNWINPDKDNAGPQGPPEWNWRGLEPGDVTLPGLLRTAGYRTLHVGKGHFAPRDAPGSDPATLGFDVNVAGASIGAPASYYGKDSFGNAPGAKRVSHAVPGLEAYHGQDIFLTEALTREAKAHLAETVAAKKPFFLYFAHYAVHAPFQADPRFTERYANAGLSPQALAFATLVEGVDQSLGDLLAHLEALGVAQDTLVLFLGDNGSDAPLGHQHDVACAAPLRGKKGSHYEGGMRVPFVAAWARPDPESPHQQRLPIAAGTIQSGLASVPDLFPTLLRLAGGEIPAAHPVDGTPLDDLLAGRPDKAREESFLMHYPHAPHRTDYWTSFREGDWKVIYHYFPTKVSGGSHYQLFHLGEDPFEQSDRASANPEVLRRMMQSLVAKLEAHGAVYPSGPEGRPAKPVIP